MRYNPVDPVLAVTLCLLLTACLPASAESEYALWADYYAWRKVDAHAEAQQAALELVEFTRSRHGEHSAQFGKALAELGVTQVLLGQYDEAFKGLSRAELILKQQLPLYSAELLSPLTFLGSALQAVERHEEALDAFTRAQHITHRLWGAHNDTQIRIVYAKADSLQALGRLQDAEHLQHTAYQLQRTNYGVRSTEAIEASARLGNWLRSIGAYHEAIRHFHGAIDEIQGSGPDIPEAYPLLRGMAHAYRGGYRGRYARSMYQRILAMMAEHPDRFSLDERIGAYLDYGDWAMQRYHEGEAVEQYEQAWSLAEAAGPDGKRWIEYLANPQLVRFGEMAPFDVSGGNEFIAFEFNLSDDGRPRKVKVVDHGAAKRASYEARRHFPKEVRFRPPIIDGEAVPLEALTSTMYVLPAHTLLEPEPVDSPQRLTDQPAEFVTFEVGR
ncbi:MAG: tetratricopeptide repeat protein [Xanthomonadales bacterium]|nr:tetratricopeptide repeat protein [Xanthomonadales bacterium]